MAVAPRPSWLYRLVGDASWPVVKVLFRHRATGVGNAPPSGGLVLAANHWSNFDPWPLAMPFFPRRFFRLMAKAELLWFPPAALPESEAVDRDRAAARRGSRAGTEP